MSVNDNYFNTYKEKERIILKKLLFKIVGSYKIAKRKETSLEIANIFFKKIAKPKYFKDDIETIKDVYLYTKYIDDNWNRFSKYLGENKIKIKKYSEIINENKIKQLSNMLDEIGDYKVNINLLPAAYKKIYKGQEIKDMDLNYITNDEFLFIQNFLLEILSQKDNSVKACLS